MALAHVRGWQVGCAGVLPASYLAEMDLAASARRWTGNIANPASANETLVAEVGSRVVALASFGRSYDADLPLDPPADEPVRIAELYLLYVHPEHWGTGVGRRLHDAALTTLADSGFTRARLWVVRGNARAQRFYRTRDWSNDRLIKNVTDGDTTWVEERLSHRVDPVEPR